MASTPRARSPRSNPPLPHQFHGTRAARAHEYAPQGRALRLASTPGSDVTPLPALLSQARLRRSAGHCPAVIVAAPAPSSHGARTQTSRSSSVVRITGIALGWIGFTTALGAVVRSRREQMARPSIASQTAALNGSGAGAIVATPPSSWVHGNHSNIPTSRTYQEALPSQSQVC
jgi:hypothetical protein